MKMWSLFFNLIGVLSLYAQTPEEIDVAIIGGGCSGLSAAVVLNDYDWKTVVFSGPQRGGSLNVKTIVGNWPGRTITPGEFDHERFREATVFFQGSDLRTKCHLEEGQAK